jgi:hypothetical protein
MRFQLALAVLAYAGAAASTSFCCYGAPPGGCDVITSAEFKLRPVGEVVSPDICCCFGQSAADCETRCVSVCLEMRTAASLPNSPYLFQ